MLIFNKIIDDGANSIFHTFENDSCNEVKRALAEFTKGKDLTTSGYDSLLTYVLEYCLENVPCPMNVSYPDCISLTMGINFFTLKLNPNFGFGVKILTTREGKIRYELSLVFEKDLVFAKKMFFYTDLISRGWKVKEVKSHKSYNKSDYKKKED